MLGFIKEKEYELWESDRSTVLKDQQSHDTEISIAWTEIHHMNFREDQN